MADTPISAIVNSELRGRVRQYGFRKAPVQITTQGIWFDLSMSPGNPAPQYYIGSIGTATQMKQSTDGGIFHGSNVSPYTKYLRRVFISGTSATPLPMGLCLCDYLMFYPFIDEGTTDKQFMVNSVSLPRYTDGAGVQVMAVSVAGRAGGQTFRINYTNQDGVAGRISTTVTQNTAAANGHIVTSAVATNGAAGPFIPLQEGDTGVRSIESVQMISGPDVGLFTLVLVKPLLQMQLIGIDATVEVDPLLMMGQCPEIEDDAYINFLSLPNGSVSGVSFVGAMKVVWN